MPQTTARSPAIEAKAGRTPPQARPLSITLGIDRMAFARHGVVERGFFRDLVDFVMFPNGRSAEGLHLPMQPSAEPALLLTEADFAPPDHVFPILLRIAAVVAVGVGLGGAAYLALSVIAKGM